MSIIVTYIIMGIITFFILEGIFIQQEVIAGDDLLDDCTGTLFAITGAILWPGVLIIGTLFGIGYGIHLLVKKFKS